MIPSDRRPGIDAPPAATDAPAEEAAPPSTAQATRGTLPPPEWTSTGGRRMPSATLTPQPLERRSGVRAEEAWLRARVEQARAAGDPAAARDACVELARWLASRDRDLDEAV